MTHDIRITVQLEPSPRLLELLERLQPGKLPGKLAGPEQPPTALETLMAERRALRKPSMPSMGETEELLHPGPEESQIKPPAVKEKPERLSRERYTLQEIPRFSDFDKPVDLPKQSLHLQYAETKDGRLMIRYISGIVWTTWTEIMKAYALKNNNVRIILLGNVGNKSTALNQFLKAMGSGLRQGQTFPGEVEDPDADFRPHLKSVIDTSTRYDGGKIEGSLEG